MGFGILKGSLYSSFCYMREIEVWGGGKIIHYKSTDPWRKEGELGCKKSLFNAFSSLFWQQLEKKENVWPVGFSPHPAVKNIRKKKEISFFFGEKKRLQQMLPSPEAHWAEHLAIYNETMISLFLHNFPPPKRVFVRTFCKGKGSVGDNFSPPHRVWESRRCVRQIRRKNFCLSRCVCHRSREGEEKIGDMPPPPQSWELILTWVMTWGACLPAREIFSFPANAFQSSMESRFF